MDGFWIAFDIEDGLLELAAHGIDGFESVVPEDFLADFIPESFLRVELRRIEPALAKAGGGRNSSAMFLGTARSPQRWLGAPSRNRRMSCLANFRESTSRNASKHAVFEAGMIR